MLRTKNELLEIMPEINEIRDESLREKVIKIWTAAMGENGWDFATLRRMPFTLLIEDVGIDFISHVRTVCKMCIAMLDVLREAYGDTIRVNRDHLIAGALLADVGKLMEYSREGNRFCLSKSGRYLRHPFLAVALASKYNVPEEVLHVVAMHSKEAAGARRSPEATVFHHADFTEFELVQ